MKPTQIYRQVWFNDRDAMTVEDKWFSFHPFTCSPDIADFSLPLTPLTTDVGHDVVDVLLRAVIVVAGVSVPIFIIAKSVSFISK